MVPRLVAVERDWRTATIGVAVVLADLQVERQRVDRHGSTFDAVLPARTVAVRRWLENPVGPIRGVWFLHISRPVGVTQLSPGQGRIRKRRDVVAAPSRSSAPVAEAAPRRSRATSERGASV